MTTEPPAALKLTVVRRTPNLTGDPRVWHPQLEAADGTVTWRGRGSATRAQAQIDGEAEVKLRDWLSSRDSDPSVQLAIARGEAPLEE